MFGDNLSRGTPLPGRSVCFHLVSAGSFTGIILSDHLPSNYIKPTIQLRSDNLYMISRYLRKGLWHINPRLSGKVLSVFQPNKNRNFTSFSQTRTKEIEIFSVVLDHVVIRKIFLIVFLKCLQQNLNDFYAIV